VREKEEREEREKVEKKSGLGKNEK